MELAIAIFLGAFLSAIGVIGYCRISNEYLSYRYAYFNDSIHSIGICYQ